VLKVATLAKRSGKQELHEKDVGRLSGQREGSCVEAVKARQVINAFMIHLILMIKDICK
jgi:hypothetical protein